jgi:hypothetical protein
MLRLMISAICIIALSGCIVSPGPSYSGGYGYGHRGYDSGYARAGDGWDGRRQWDRGAWQR